MLARLIAQMEATMRAEGIPESTITSLVAHIRSRQLG